MYSSFNFGSILFYSRHYRDSSDNKHKIKPKPILHNHTEHKILDPFSNRNKIAKLSKNKKGVYIFKVLGTNDVYVGSSINLYNRVPEALFLFYAFYFKKFRKKSFKIF